jgi:hypothetical protein
LHFSKAIKYTLQTWQFARDYCCSLGLQLASFPTMDRMIDAHNTVKYGNNLFIVLAWNFLLNSKMFQLTQLHAFSWTKPMQMAMVPTPGAPQISRFRWKCIISKHIQAQSVTYGPVA